MKKQKKIEPIKDSNYIIRDLSINEIIPNNIDNYLINVYEGHHLIVLPSSILGIQFKNWQKSRGGIFSKDVLNYTLKKEFGKYILIKGDGKYFIARLISDDEHLKFEALKLIDGQIKDKSYMILKHLNEEENNLINTKIYIYEKNIDEEPVHFYPSLSEQTNDDEIKNDYHGNSISLFTNE